MIILSPASIAMLAAAPVVAPSQQTSDPVPSESQRPVEQTPVSPQQPIDERPAQGPATASTGYPTQAQGLGPKVGPKFYMSRWVEDWSYLRDKSKRTDFFDPLKFIPLNDSKSVYLTLSGEHRLRLNHTSNIGLRQGAPSQDQILARFFAGADLHVGENFRVFGELASGILGGRNVLPASPANRNDLHVQQLFADVHGEVAGADMGVRVGRQDFMDGPIPLVSVQENPNIHFTLDGVRGWANWDRARFTLFDFSYVQKGLGAFDDPTDSRERLRGGLASFLITPTGQKDKIFFDPFIWDGREDGARRGATIGRERRQYYGARLWGTTGPVKFDWSVVKQTGRLQNRQIDAYQIFTNQTIALSDKGWQPELGFRAELSSGGGTFGTGTINSASFLFGTVINYSFAPFIGPTNFRALTPTLTVRPTKKLRVAMEYVMAQRDSVTDAVYNGLGGFFAGTQNVPGRGIANLARANIVYNLTPHLNLNLRMEYVDAKSALTNAGYGDTFFAAPYLQFRF